MSNKEYFDSLGLFYSERLKSQIKKKHQKCEGCEQIKQFIVKNNRLIFSCGAKSGKCGPKYIITLANYMNYPEMVSDVTKALNYYLDKSKLPTIYSKKEISEQNDIIKENELLFKKSKKQFIKQNDLIEKEKLIKTIHKKRITIKKDQSLILFKIKNETDPDKKYNLRNDYLMLQTQLKELYNELYLIKETDKFITIEPGEVIKK